MHEHQIIAVAVVLSFCFAAVMAAVTRFLLPKHGAFTSTTTSPATDIERQPELTHISRSWRRRFTPKHKHTNNHWVPSLAAVIEAGDESLFTSELFRDQHEDLRLEGLYQAFANQLQTRPPSERSAYSAKITKFLAEAKQDAQVLGRAKSVSRRVLNVPMDNLQKANRRHSNPIVGELSLKRGLSVKKSAPVLMSLGSGIAQEGSEGSLQKSWMHDFQIAGHEGGSMSLKLSPAELAAISVILGSSLTSGAIKDNDTRACAFGISLSMTATENGGRKVQLQGQERRIWQQHALGVGTSTLFAKHLAAGSLPYLQDNEAAHSILFTNDTAEAVRSGTPLSIHGDVESTPQSMFLSSLPSSQSFKFHALAPSTEQISLTPLIDAIAGLPFSGGLTPLASGPLIKTVQFIASGGLAPERLLQRLEDLVDKVHSYAPHLDIFGPLYKPQNAGLMYRERLHLGRLARDPAERDSLVDKTARMSRYITLLQRLMALVPDMRANEVLATVQAATKLELQSSYADAVAAHINVPRVQSPVILSDCHSTTSSTSACASKRASTATKLTAYSASSPAASTRHIQPDLTQQVEQILKRDLPLDVDAIAFVVRMVIVAWTLSVDTVAWDDGEEGFRVPDISSLGDNIILC